MRRFESRIVFAFAQLHTQSGFIFFLLGNTAETNYTYNQQNLRLTNLTTSGGLQNLGYQYDNVGNVTQIVDNVRGETSQFTYDDLNRLLSVNLTGGSSPYSQGWQYDPIGNITQRTGTNAAAYAYTDPAHKHAATSMGSNSYSYDANGNMATRAGDALSYDAENRLTLATNSGTQYTYNGDGARVKKVMGGTTTYYVGNYFEVSVTGGVTTTTKYYYFGAQRIAMRDASGVTYLHSDHLGSTSATSGANPGFQVYFPFGGLRAGNLPTDYGFTGQKLDASDGLMYYGARYYDAALGRFISADTIVPSAGNPQSLNRYAYVLNNPVRYTDPSGHAPKCGICDIDPPPPPPPCGDGDCVGFTGGVISGGTSGSGVGQETGITTEQPKPDDSCQLRNCDRESPTDLYEPRFHLISDDKPRGCIVAFSEFLAGIFCGGGGGGTPPKPPVQGNGPWWRGGGGSGSRGGSISPYGFPQNSTEPPVPGFVWRGNGQPGSSEGSWVRPGTLEYLRWDSIRHGGTGHWDYRDAGGNEFWIWPDGSMEPK